MAHAVVVHGFQCTNKTRANGRLGGIQRRRKANQGEGAAVESLIFKILSGSLAIMLQGKCRTSISEWICKHQVWPEAAELGTSHFHFSETLEGGTDTRGCMRLVRFQEISAERFKFHVRRVDALSNTWHSAELPLRLLWSHACRLCRSGFTRGRIHSAVFRPHN